MLKSFSILFCLLSFSSFSQSEGFHFLKVGDAAPAFVAMNQQHEKIELKELIKKGKVLLIFYRGEWCPYCNRHMSNLQDSLNLIIEKGATLIAVTPEVESSIEQSIEKTKATFNIVHDSAYTIMDQYGVRFMVENKTVLKYKLAGINLEKANGNTDNMLPVPATFIINQQGTIDFIHFDENYKKRLPVNEILKQLDP